MKGQNLRLTLGGKCVAASKTLNFHVSANVEDISSKDSDGDWAENECTGKSWDASVDAMVIGRESVQQELKQWNNPDDYTAPCGTGTQYITPSEGIVVHPGETVRSWSSDVSQSHYLSYGFLIKKVAATVVVLWHFTDTWDKDYMEWTNNTQSNVTVYVANEGTSAAVRGIAYAATYMADDAKMLEDFETSMISETEFTARFIATDPVSAKNRVEEECYAEGTCVITDISVNAQSRQTATYSVKLQGVGALDFNPE